MTATRARHVRPAWWPEVLLIGSLYGAYTLTRNAMPSRIGLARSNALDLLDVEQRLGIDVEHAVNTAVASPGAHAVAVLANYTYSLAHFGVTLAVLGWLFARHPSAYRPARTILLVSTIFALAGYWLFPLAPPRFFPSLGYVDTVVRDQTFASWGSHAVVSISNQYAAMPSMHAGWSIWVGVTVVLVAHRRWVRAVAALYPLLMVSVIVGTGNHWVLDAVGGLAALALGTSAYLLVARHRRRDGDLDTPGRARPATTSTATGQLTGCHSPQRSL